MSLERSFRGKSDALEDTWADFGNEFRSRNVVFLKEFQVFEEKASAINLQTGVSDQLAGMIKKWLIPGQTLAVGNADYKTIIEAKLGIYCLFNDAVMEVMWGLKNLMKSIVPDEKSDLTDEDRPRMCQGMKIVLDRHNIYVKPEMINRCIIEMTCSVYDCDFYVRKHMEILRRGGQSLLEVSKINCEQWHYMKLATALKLVCYPEEGIELGNSPEMLSVDEARKLRGDAHQYEGELRKYTFRSIYKELVWARGIRTKAL